MIKNSHLHLVLETNYLEKLKDQARSRGLSLSEFCRNKLLESHQLDKIEIMLEKILRKNEI